MLNHNTVIDTDFVHGLDLDEIMRNAAANDLNALAALNRIDRNGKIDMLTKYFADVTLDVDHGDLTGYVSGEHVMIDPQSNGWSGVKRIDGGWWTDTCEWALVPTRYITGIEILGLPLPDGIRSDVA